MCSTRSGRLPATGRFAWSSTRTHTRITQGGNLKIAQAGSQLVAGNFAQQLGQEGARSAFIVAHENVLKAMSAPTGATSPSPFGAWPTDTFFQEEKDLYFNEEGIQLVHEPAAHTDGDVLVFFRSSDVIATGDVFNITSYPAIDLARKGHVNGIIEALNRIIDLAISEQFTEGGTRIVPGHGRICDEFEVVEYRDMVTIVRDRVQAMIREGHDARSNQGRAPHARLRSALRIADRARNHVDGDVRRKRVCQFEGAR